MTSSPTPTQATRLLHDYVPLLATMGAEVTHLDADTVTVVAPLSANRNLHGTAFGGSLSMLGIVCGWLLALVGQQNARPTRNIVVADSRTRFLHPLNGDIEAVATWNAAAAATYRATLADGARAAVDIEVRLGAAPAAMQKNRYVAVP